MPLKKRPKAPTNSNNPSKRSKEIEVTVDLVKEQVKQHGEKLQPIQQQQQQQLQLQQLQLQQLQLQQSQFQQQQELGTV
jgi:hypothetical protein